MYGLLKCWGMATGMVCVAASAALATEPFVQDFDGWKITIRPGLSSLPDLPPSPRSATPSAKSVSSGSIQLVSLRQNGVAPAPAPEGEPEVPVIDGLPVITPGESSQCCDPKPAVSPPEGTVDPRYMSQMYLEIYKSIPFIRAEYDANPSYIHDTAVEFLFGKMRPTVIHRGTVNVNQNYQHGYDVPYAYGGLGYAYPRLQLVVPGTGLRIHRLN